MILAAVVACKSESHAPPPPAPEPASKHAFYAPTFSKRPSVADMTALGALIFRDPSLSGSGKLACATCHDPGRAFGPPNAAAVQLGGPGGDLAGVRAVPSLRYLQAVPRFTEHYHEPDDDAQPSEDGPAGGLTWDGRAQTTHDQARAPLFSPLEMANASPDELIARVRRTAYADRFRATFGDDVLATTDSALKATLLALEVYQQDPATFYPYDSKYDAVLRGKAKLTPQEARGLAAFVDPERGNCARCHPSTISQGFPAFTDFGYEALAVPRNREIPANHDPAYFDLGLCGPYRNDLSTHADYCGLFRTPSLRNTALRHRFMHNGVFTTLDQVMQFYATRDLTPARWYPSGKPDDLPERYAGNVSQKVPFGRRRRLSDADIADIIAFLQTLTDGYQP